MARTIEAIKKEMTDAFLADETLQEMYGIVATKTWGEQFSKVSVENIMFGIVASALYVLESLFDAHKDEVADTISKRAHTLTWYREKALAFESGMDLSTDLAEYDNSGKTDEEISVLQIVKKCSCEVADSTYPTIIVKATKDDDPLTESELTNFTAYMKEIADAGVKIITRSMEPDTLKLNMIVWYDPLVLNANGVLYTDGETKPAEDVIKEYLEDLPFNGTFYPHLLEQYLVQNAQGVRMARVVASEAEYTPETTATTEEITNFYKPYSGAMQWDGGSDGFTITYNNFSETYE